MQVPNTLERKTLWLSRFLFQVITSCVLSLMLSYYKSEAFAQKFAMTEHDPRWVEYGRIVLLVCFIISTTMAIIAAWKYTKYAKPRLDD